MFKAELGDKTCLILIILTICWSNWYRDVPFPYFKKKVVNPQDEAEELPSPALVSPLEILVCSTAGILVFDTFSCLKQKNIYLNESRAISSGALLIMFVVYLYRICKFQFIGMANFEKMKMNKQASIDQMLSAAILMKYTDSMKDIKDRKQAQERLSLQYGVNRLLEYNEHLDKKI